VCHLSVVRLQDNDKLENCRWLRTEVRFAVLTLDLDLTLTSNPRRAMVTTHTFTKGQVQRSLGSKLKLETDGQTDGGDCIISHANAVCNKNRKLTRDFQRGLSTYLAPFSCSWPLFTFTNCILLTYLLTDYVAGALDSGDQSSTSSEDFDPTTIVRRRRDAAVFLDGDIDAGTHCIAMSMSVCLSVCPLA